MISVFSTHRVHKTTELHVSTKNCFLHLKKNQVKTKVTKNTELLFRWLLKGVNSLWKKVRL